VLDVDLGHAATGNAGRVRLYSLASAAVCLGVEAENPSAESQSLSGTRRKGRRLEAVGQARILSIADRQSDRAKTITFWDGLESLRASEERADELRSRAADAMGDTIARVERYEVALQEARRLGNGLGRVESIRGDRNGRR
jgi:hypothetical protein